MCATRFFRISAANIGGAGNPLHAEPGPTIADGQTRVAPKSRGRADHRPCQVRRPARTQPSRRRPRRRHQRRPRRRRTQHPSPARLAEGSFAPNAGRPHGGFRREVQPRRQHWFLNEKSGFPFRTPAFCSVSRGQRRLGEKEYRAPSVTPGVALRPRTQGRSLSSSDKSRRSITIRTGRLDAWLSHSTSSEVAFVYLLRMMVGYVFRSDQAAHRATVVPPAPGVCSNAIVADLDLCTTPVRLAHTP